MSIRINYGKIKENQMAKKQEIPLNKISVGDEVYFVERVVNVIEKMFGPNEIIGVAYKKLKGRLVSMDEKNAVVEVSGFFVNYLKQVVVEYIFVDDLEAQKFLISK